MEDLQSRTAELREFIADSRQTYGLEALCAVGCSYGANISANLLLQNDDATQGAVLLQPAGHQLTLAYVLPPGNG